MKDDEPTLPKPDERKTVDLCGREHLGARCMHQRGHDGPHECLYWSGGRALHWE